MNSIGNTREKNGEKKKELRHFICSIDADAEKFVQAVRNHWGIESMHWALDEHSEKMPKEPEKTMPPRIYRYC